MYKGNREAGVDYFDDISNRMADGVFAGQGVDDFEGVKEQINADGLEVKLNCRRCGKTAAVTLEWNELYVVGTNGAGKSLLLPPGWQYSPNNSACYPANLPCSKCAAPLCPQVTPDDARKRVEDAVSQGVVSLPQVQQWQASVGQYRRQSGG